MNSQTTTYQKVAEKCHEYCPCRECDSCANSVSGEECPSCLKCEHFDNLHCCLDLYDKIVNRI